MEHFFLSSFEKIGKMTFPDPPPRPPGRENSRLFLKIFNEVFPKTLLEMPDLIRYDELKSPITNEYEVITSFMDMYNISATWELDPTIHGWNIDIKLANTREGFKNFSFANE